MTEQENILHSAWRIIWLEQKKEKLYQEYIDKIGALIMTVKELIEKLQQENPDALVYTMDNSDDVALIVTKVSRNILEGKDETVTIH